MSREPAPGSATSCCKHCGRGTHEHQLVVNPSGVVTAGAWTGGETVTYCADEALDATLRDLVIQIARLELEAHAQQAQVTVQTQQIQELVAENTALRALVAPRPPTALPAYPVH
jgi:hypothetical protein